MYRQTEEMQREDTELGPVSQNVVTVDGEIMTPTGKLLLQAQDFKQSQSDRVSVCSCTCYPRYVSLPTKNLWANNTFTFT